MKKNKRDAMGPSTDGEARGTGDNAPRRSFGAGDGSPKRSFGQNNGPKRSFGSPGAWRGNDRPSFGGDRTQQSDDRGGPRRSWGNDGGRPPSRWSRDEGRPPERSWNRDGDAPQRRTWRREDDARDPAPREQRPPARPATPARASQPLPLSAGKLRHGLTAAQRALNEVFATLGGKGRAAVQISEVQATVSFDAEGSFIGFGSGGVASMVLTVQPHQPAAPTEAVASSDEPAERVPSLGHQTESHAEVGVVQVEAALDDEDEDDDVSQH